MVREGVWLWDGPLLFSWSDDATPCACQGQLKRTFKRSVLPRLKFISINMAPLKCVSTRSPGYPQPEHLGRDHMGCPFLWSLASLQHPDPLLPLGQTQSSGLHGLQIRCASPQALSALRRVSASSTLRRRATPHPWSVGERDRPWLARFCCVLPPYVSKGLTSCRVCALGRQGEVQVGLTLSLMSSSMGLLPHSISTISLACPGTA